MPATIQIEPTGVCLLRVSGVLQQSEFVATQDVVARAIDAGSKPCLLAILENFEGWEQGVAWGNLDFMYWYANEITKIALVGEPRWEKEALAFAGAGSRSAPVKFFPSDQEAQARAWLSE